MIPKVDFHTHTSYCDGKDTPRQMVEEAYRRGFSCLGISGHSFTSFDDGWCMSLENTKKYIEEINLLKKEYQGRMDILCGIERDYYATPSEFIFDYVIGSVHYVKVGQEYFSVDYTPEETKRIVNEYFQGDFDAFAESYFSNVSDIVEKTDCDIIGHFDLVSKFSDSLGIHESERYLEAGYNAIRNLIKYDKPFEINIGAIIRGYKQVPYPSEKFMAEILRLGGKVCVSGDCHNCCNLGNKLEVGYSFARKCGFDTVQVFTKDGFHELKIVDI